MTGAFVARGRLSAAEIGRFSEVWAYEPGDPVGPACARHVGSAGPGPLGSHPQPDFFALPPPPGQQQQHLVDVDDGEFEELPLPLAAPEDGGLSTSRLRALSAWSDGRIDTGKIPGMLTCIVRRGKLVYLHTSGKADVEADRPMAPNTIVRLYSLSKPLVSVCAMCLYERGVFQLDEPISHHLPSLLCPDSPSTRCSSETKPPRLFALRRQIVMSAEW